MSSFIGFTGLDEALAALHVVRNGSDIPDDADALPTFRVYGPSGLMANGTGSLSYKEDGVVTGATDASPIVITSQGHGLTTGMRVNISGVLGNTAANGDFNITYVDSNSFSLDSSVGNGTYTSGGAWHAAGLYEFSITPTGANGYAEGDAYTVVVYWLMSTQVRCETYRFGVA